MNLSIDCTIVFLKYSTIPVRFCTCYCNVCLSTSAAYIIDVKRTASSSASSFSSIAFIAWSFDSFSSAVSLHLSVLKCSITVVKLISGLEASYSFR